MSLAWSRGACPASTWEYLKSSKITILSFPSPPQAWGSSSCGDSEHRIEPLNALWCPLGTVMGVCDLLLWK